MKSKKSKGLLAFIVAGALSFSAIPIKNVNAIHKVDRLYGSGRYETAKAISEKFTKADIAILVTGENYPDALAATPLAKKYNAPILLTEKNNLNVNTSEELQRLGTKKVFIVGGVGVITEDVEEQLKSIGIETERLQGKTRYETSVKVAEKVGLTKGIFLTTGEGFADALGVGPIAANLGMPVVLTTKDVLNSSTEKLLKENSIPKTYVVGGRGVVADSVANKFSNSERIEGLNRYATNKALIDKFKNNLSFDNTYVATGNNFPDALAGGALAAINNNPIVLTDLNPANETMTSLENVKKMTILGGDGVITKFTEDKLIGKNVTDLKMHFINVGQADAILIENNGETMLVDAGNNDDETVIKNYLESQNVSYINYLIGTHPHEDHIGAMDYVINSLQIGKVYMPKTVSNTQTYRDVISAISNKGMQITPPTIGESFYVGSAKCTILGPRREYENTNDNSIVIKVEFGNNSFLLMGDAEATSEMDMVNGGAYLKSDVIKLGHHGSKTSSVPNFLSKVSPKYAVASVGKGNSYKHPSQSVMDRLNSSKVPVYRTDESGTIISTSNGSIISFNTKQGSYVGGDYVNPTPPSTSNPDKPPINPPTVAQTVYVTNSGKSFHRTSTCSNMKSPIAMSRQNAINKGYKQCSKCKP